MLGCVFSQFPNLPNSTPLAHHVLDVFEMRSGKQVIRPHAARVIAAVAGISGVSYSITPKQGEPVCFAIFPCDFYLAVTATIDAGSPAPAISVRAKTRRLINFCPKSFPKRLTGMIGSNPVYTPLRTEPFSFDLRPATLASVDARELCGSYTYSHDRTPNAVLVRLGVVLAHPSSHVFYRISAIFRQA